MTKTEERQSSRKRLKFLQRSKKIATAPIKVVARFARRIKKSANKKLGNFENNKTYLKITLLIKQNKKLIIRTFIVLLSVALIYMNPRKVLANNDRLNSRLKRLKRTKKITPETRARIKELTDKQEIINKTQKKAKNLSNIKDINITFPLSFGVGKAKMIKEKKSFLPTFFLGLSVNEILQRTKSTDSETGKITYKLPKLTFLEGILGSIATVLFFENRKNFNELKKSTNFKKLLQKTKLFLNKIIAYCVARKMLLRKVMTLIFLVITLIYCIKMKLKPQGEPLKYNLDDLPEAKQRRLRSMEKFVYKAREADIIPKDPIEFAAFMSELDDYIIFKHYGLPLIRSQFLEAYYESKKNSHSNFNEDDL